MLQVTTLNGEEKTDVRLREPILDHFKSLNRYFLH